MAEEDYGLQVVPVLILFVLLLPLVLSRCFSHPTGSSRRQRADAEFLSEECVESFAGHGIGSSGGVGGDGIGEKALPHRTVPLHPPPRPFASGTYVGTYDSPESRKAPEYQRSVVDPFHLPPFQLRFLPLTQHIPGQITIEGEGTDGVGPYHLTGRYALHPFRVVLTKHYGPRGEYLRFNTNGIYGGGTRVRGGPVDADAEGRTEGYYLATDGECRWSRGGGGEGTCNPMRDMHNVDHRFDPVLGKSFNLHNVHIRLSQAFDEGTGNVSLRGKFITGSNDDYEGGGDITIWQVGTEAV